MEPTDEGTVTRPRRRKLMRIPITIALAAVLTIGGITIATASNATHQAGAATVQPHAIDAFIVFSMSMPGITGGSTAGQPGDIDLSSFSWGVSRPVTSSGGAGKVTFNPFSITRKIDSASPQLFQGCASGHHYPKATLYLRAAQGGTGDGMTIEFTNVLITHDSWSASSDGTTPTETITMVPKSYKVSYDLAKATK